MSLCPFCATDPFEYVEVGDKTGSIQVPVAVVCCEFGGMLFDDRTEDRRFNKIANEILARLPDLEGPCTIGYREALIHQAWDIFFGIIEYDSWQQVFAGGPLGAYFSEIYFFPREQ